MISPRADFESAASSSAILILGSRNLWNDLLFRDLVDELHLMVGTLLLGNGTPQQRPRWGP